MTPKYTKIAAVAAGAMLAIGGVAVAANAADPSATPSASSSSSTSGGTVTTTDGATSDDSTTEGHGKGGRGGMGRAGHSHTAVTGDEATKVVDAVKAKDSTITVESVRKDPDGSYDAIGTKDGQPVMVNVSADLATIEIGQGGGKGGGMGRAGHSHTEVTGAEATKVTDAVEAKDSGYTVTSVQKDADGSYDVHATKADGTTVMLEVSADLATIEERVRGNR
ncbi:MAG TPA: hypothetical protein VLR88_03595 [Propionibacteriaceae bacterium]|nr:hypothetical protein [Propionibacteriaceae bacterium]